MYTTKIGRRGQVTIPRQVRRMAGLQEGDRIAFVPLGDRILIEPLQGSLLELRGVISVSGRQDFEDIRRQVRSARAGRDAERGG